MNDRARTVSGTRQFILNTGLELFPLYTITFWQQWQECGTTVVRICCNIIMETKHIFDGRQN